LGIRAQEAQVQSSISQFHQLHETQGAAVSEAAKSSSLVLLQAMPKGRTVEFVVHWIAFRSDSKIVTLLKTILQARRQFAI